MKKYACNRLYLSDGKYLINQIIEIDDGGRVTDYFPLTHEVSNTIWLGGTIIIINSYAWHVPGMAVYDFMINHYKSKGILLK